MKWAWAHFCSSSPRSRANGSPISASIVRMTEHRRAGVAIVEIRAQRIGATVVLAQPVDVGDVSDQATMRFDLARLAGIDERADLGSAGKSAVEVTSPASRQARYGVRA